ncbi:MAG TPA: hypothetical protein VM532_10575, partial [Burkholderiales bacterium]|nr:hypothetical protein [Burkholderiales bacterium]
EMSDEEWQHSFARCLGVMLSGEALDERDQRGRPVRDDNFLLLLNAHHEAIQFTLPTVANDTRWVLVMDTHQGVTVQQSGPFAAGDNYTLQERSLVLLKEVHRDPRNGG